MPATACPVNIGPRGRRQRLAMAIGMFVLTAMAFAWLVAAGQPRAARLLLFVPLWIAGLGFFQSRAGT